MAVIKSQAERVEYLFESLITLAYIALGYFMEKGISEMETKLLYYNKN